MVKIDKGDAQIILDRLALAWRENDGSAFGAPFFEDAHFVAFDGTVLKGADAIGKYHQAAFDHYLKDTQLVISIDSTCAASSDTFLVFINGNIEEASGGTVQLNKASVATMVLVMRDGEARIQAFQNTRNRPINSRSSAQVWKEFDRMWDELE